LSPPVSRLDFAAVAFSLLAAFLFLRCPMAQLTLRLKLRWWLRPVMTMIVVVNHFTAWRPREQSIKWLVRHAVYIESAK
jgi:hypothetical protein